MSEEQHKNVSRDLHIQLPPSQTSMTTSSVNEPNSEKPPNSPTQFRSTAQSMMSSIHRSEALPEVKADLQRLRRLLQVPPASRNRDILQQIFESTSSIQFLKKYRDTPEYFDICKNFLIKSYSAQQFIFKQGDIGDSFYVILNGGVTIYIDEPTEYKNFMQLKEMNRLGCGAAFGEIALITNSKRTATIMANQPTELIVLKKDSFPAFLLETRSHHLSAMQNFLERLNLFSLFTTDNIIEVSTKCRSVQFPSNTIIMRQGDSASAIYFVKRGLIKAVRQIPFKYDNKTNEKVPFDISDPPQSFKMNPKNQKQFSHQRTTTSSSNQSSDSPFYFQGDFIEIDEFNESDVFGEYAVLHEQPSEYSAITATPCEVVFISLFDLHQILDISKLNLYGESLQPYPKDSDIRRVYWERKQWAEYCERAVSSIASQQKASKLSFQESLRKSVSSQRNPLIPFNLSDIQIAENQLYFEVIQHLDKQQAREDSLALSQSDSLQQHGTSNAKKRRQGNTSIIDRMIIPSVRHSYSTATMRPSSNIIASAIHTEPNESSNDPTKQQTDHLPQLISKPSISSEGSQPIIVRNSSFLPQIQQVRANTEIDIPQNHSSKVSFNKSPSNKNKVKKVSHA